ncbi:Hypothetical protein Eab7_1491 [Exiguobacterium antarcticum B7]|nr:Hypothetical protein Eab7_1491 [Exiguobacterium antarcticum B7]
MHSLPSWKVVFFLVYVIVLHHFRKKKFPEYVYKSVKKGKQVAYGLIDLK